MPLLLVLLFGIGVLIVSLFNGDPLYPQFAVASLPCIAAMILSAVGSRFKSPLTFRLAMAAGLWAAAVGATIGPAAAVTWAVGFGCIGGVFGTTIERPDSC